MADIKRSILYQSKKLDEVEYNYNQFERALLKREEEFMEMKRKIIEDFHKKFKFLPNGFNDITTISGIVNYINFQYEELDLKITQIENREVEFNSLKELNEHIKELLNRYSLVKSINEQLEQISQLEKEFMILPENE